MPDNPTPTILNKCKMAMRISTDAYDTEINEYISAARLDLQIGGVSYSSEDSLVTKAIITYVRMSFGAPANYDKLKAAYEEQKAQLMNATGYTVWSDS